MRRELSFSESPRSILCVGGIGGTIVIGFKKHYENIELQNYNGTKIVEFEKEHRLVSFEVFFLFINISIIFIFIFIFIFFDIDTTINYKN